MYETLKQCIFGQILFDSVLQFNNIDWSTNETVLDHFLCDSPLKELKTMKVYIITNKTLALTPNMMHFRLKYLRSRLIYNKQTKEKTEECLHYDAQMAE